MSKPVISIRPLPAGAEVVGFEHLLDSTPVGSQARCKVRSAWADYGALLFRGVSSVDMHLEISRCFGELEMHPVEYLRASENRFLMTIGDEVSYPYIYDETDIKVGVIPWHRDTAFTVRVAKGAMLRVLETPSRAGETMLCDTARAYDDLPDELKDRLLGVEYRASLRRTPQEYTGPGTIWNSVRPLTDEEARSVGLVPPSEGGRPMPVAPPLPSVVHPAVLSHPETCRQCLFLSPKEFDFFLGMERGVSDDLFANLIAHMLQDRYVYRHAWQVDDALVWDNLRFMHAAAGSHLGDRRKGLRTTLATDGTVGRLYDEAVDKWT